MILINFYVTLMKKSIILLVDALINFALGLILLVFSPGVISFLGIPETDQSFYANILGAVLFGIGIALIIEYISKKEGLVGLGLGGAVVINICGGIVLALWLIFGGLVVPLKGKILLWIIVFILVFISLFELLIYYRKRG